MFGQMTAGSWIYIGSQGIVQGTYETFVEAGRQHFGGDLRGPLDPHRRPRRHGRRAAAGRDLRRRVVADHRMPAEPHRLPAAHRATSTSRRATSTTRWRASAALHRARSGRSRSACSATPPSCCPSSCSRRRSAGGIRPDLVTDQTSAHDLVNGYLPAGWTVERWRAAQADPAQHAALREAAAASLRDARAGDARLPGDGRADGRLRQQHPPGRASTRASPNAFAFPGFVPAYIRPLFCRGKGPFRWVALSGDPEDIRKTDAKLKELFPADAHLHRWLDMAGERIAFQGLPARICWLGLGERHRAGLAFNEMVKSRRAEGADRRSAATTSTRARWRARTARPRRCRTAATRSPTGRCSTPCSTPRAARPGSRLHHGGGVGMGYSQHAGVVDRLRRHARRRPSASSACSGTTRRRA